MERVRRVGGVLIKMTREGEGGDTVREGWSSKHKDA